MKSGFSAIFSVPHKQQRGEYSGVKYSMSIRPLYQRVKYALFWPNVRIFSTVGYYARVVPVLVPLIIMSFFCEHPVFV